MSDGLAEDVVAKDPRALNQLGREALARGDGANALHYLRAADAADPNQPALLFNLSAAHRIGGDLRAALDTLQAALTVDPYFVQAMFQMGVIYEDLGDRRSAASIYRNFLDTIPKDVADDQRFETPIKHARDFVDTENAGLEAKLVSVSRNASVRIKESLSALVGRDRIYTSEPTFLTIPRLPAIPFFDRALTPWIEDLESHASAIAAEASTVLGDVSAFAPYVEIPAGTPSNQWDQLNQSSDWGALFFWRHGRRFDDAHARFPATAAALASAPLIDLHQRGPNAFFSNLRPGVRIPPHTGVTNARATVHLPLIVPDGCGFRVGAERRRWKPGEAWVFDDTIEHEAWNASDQPRVILIFDIWHPMLDEAECAALTEAFAVYDQHNGIRRAAGDEF